MREMAPADAASPTLPPAALCVAPVSKMDVQATLLAIVSDRTGYPTEMLGLDLNLEAELSIDSIKRIEILGQLGHELGLLRKQSGGGDELLEQLATKKTLRTIVAWLEEHMAAQAGGGSVASGAESASAAETTRREDAATVTVPSAGGEEIPEPPPTLESVDKIDDLDEAPSSEVRSHRSSAPAVEAAPGRSTIRRFVIGTVEAPHLAGSSVSIARQTWALVAGRSSLAAPLQQALVARGAKVVMANGTLPERLDGIIDLSALGEDAGLAPEKALFDRALAAHRAGVRRLLVATVAGGPGGREHHRPRPGVAGLLRTLARETGIEARAIGLDLGEAGRDGARLVEHLVTELETRDDRVEVAWQGGVRRATTTVAVPRARAPGKDGLRLGSDSVVLVTGGARGITAAVTCALARRFQCRLELVGRSAAPTGVEDADLASAADMLALRKAIIARGERSPAAIEALATRVLAAREIGATMRGIVEAGASVGYHALDVRDERAVHALVDDLYARHGRIDGVIHGAGLIEDKLLADKTRASFDRVFDTKVVPARALLERLRADVGFVAFFSSIAAVFGSRGQIDYAAANDALDKLAWWQSQRSAARVLSVNWGPWAGGGMVSPELERQYARRGIGLVDPGEGAAAFLEELLEGTDPQVVLMNAEPEALSARPSLPGGGPDAATAALAAADHHRREQRADG
ncbi:MAG: SDR family NAD(P)-dependent oxidoreductase [Polyangiaceae bacterium]